MTDWQPIETAPRDGTRILVWSADFQECMTAHWFNGDWSETWDDQGDLIATHWMPLPEPPP